MRNSLAAPLTLLIPAAIHGGPEQAGAMDSAVIAPGAVGVLSTRAATPGNYVYRATTPNGASQDAEMAGLLAGALAVDTAGAAPVARDRVFVIMATADSTLVSYADTATTCFPLRDSPTGRVLYTINGRSWPNTERITATAGDTLHWRVINASVFLHPMHLHGFYYRVDGLSGPLSSAFQRPAPGEMVVTQLLDGMWAMSMTWSPDRPGNWIFHCHLAVHLQPDSLSAESDDAHLRGMVGLVLGVNVAARPGARAASAPVPVRHLRLIAVAKSRPEKNGAATMSVSEHFVLEENGHRVETATDLSPELDLTRGEPVSIMIVNHLAEPTSVHWHGIEVQDSYVDGVVGFSGAAGH
ncbi:MAG: multicopper oxidase domain-containing protein, partial [Gemmatimonadaceae bacterium]